MGASIMKFHKGRTHKLVSTVFYVLLIAIFVVACSSQDNKTSQATKVVKKVVQKKPAKGPVPPGNSASLNGGNNFPGYSGVKMRDPFIPFLKSAEDAVKKQAALTPLEKFSLGELKVVGIIKRGRSIVALVEDNGGKGYTVKKGMKIGKNGGFVSKIDKTSILVIEEIVDISGKKVRKEKRLELPGVGGE
jgi:type IV pilus assembly protein PilP